MDDYGVEDFKGASSSKPENVSADSKKTADKTPEEVQKTADKLSAIKISSDGDANLYKQTQKK
jgi:hypothetical protein